MTHVGTDSGTEEAPQAPETEEAAETSAGTEPSSSEQDDWHEGLIAEGDAAGDYLERLLDILDYDGDIDLDVDGERAAVSIIGEGELTTLVGEDGAVLNALQELTRLAVAMETGRRSRLILDIAGYRAGRREELTELGRTTAAEVIATGEPIRLGAMNPFERKVVHDAVAAIDGVTSASEGEEPRRRVIVSPA